MEFIFTGIDGSQLLGYMAALGVFRTLAEGNPAVRLWWQVGRNGVYCPVLSHPEAAGEDDLVALLARQLGIEPLAEPLDCSSKWKNLPEGREFAGYLLDARTKGDSPLCAFVTALGSAALEQKDGVDDSAFRTMGGAGHQDFLDFMKMLHRDATALQIRQTLFERWTYTDEGLAMRWDSVDFRPHALRARDPSGEKGVSVRGANRLAMEALPFFPVLPRRKRGRKSGANATVGFVGKRGEAIFRWPIWTPPLRVDSVRSLLLCCPGWIDDRNGEKGARWSMEVPGVDSVWESRRFTEGRFRNFTPARRVL